MKKVKRKLNNLGVPDVLECKRVFRGYPTEKPIPLIEILIQQSSSSGELVIDPFFGSGATFLAAKNCGREYLGSDISEDAHDYFNNREHD